MQVSRTRSFAMGASLGLGVVPVVISSAALFALDTSGRQTLVYGQALFLFAVLAYLVARFGSIRITERRPTLIFTASAGAFGIVLAVAIHALF